MRKVFVKCGEALATLQRRYVAVAGEAAAAADEVYDLEHCVLKKYNKTTVSIFKLAAKWREHASAVHFVVTF